jgi:hypothetical protein
MTRRTLLSTIATPLMAQRRPVPYEILIRGGEVCDPSRGFKKKADVGIAGGKIAAIEDAIDAARGIDVIDAKGLYVTPGLVDLHSHVHTGLGTGIDADKLAAASGATTWVDAGTFAHDELPGFRRFIVNPAQTRIYGYVYLYPASRNPDIDPVKHVRGAMRATGEAAQANRDIHSRREVPGRLEHERPLEPGVSQDRPRTLRPVSASAHAPHQLRPAGNRSGDAPRARRRHCDALFQRAHPGNSRR